MGVWEWGVEFRGVQAYDGETGGQTCDYKNETYHCFCSCTF